MHNIVEPFNDQNAQSSFNSSEVEANKIIVAICYIIPILFFLPVVMDKNSSYCKFHANQQLTLLIVEIVVGIICAIIGMIPIVGAIIGALIGLAVLSVVIGFVYGTLTGMALRFPFIGNLIEIF